MKDPAPLSQRFDLDYVHRRWWPWRWTMGLSLVLGIAAITWAAIAVNIGDHRAFTSGTLTHAHSFIANDCAACHQPDATRSGYWLPAADAACVKCHTAAAHSDPHGKLFAGQPHSAADRLTPMMMSSRCAACHIEHRGADRNLAGVGDPTCVQCHGDLHAYGIASPTIAASVKQFGDDHPQWRIFTSPQIDQTPLRFEHAVHVNPDTPQMQTRLRAWVESQRQAGVAESSIPVKKSNGDALVMNCAACHVADEAGAYMKPIVFEQHCAACHNLGQRGGETVPHGVNAAAFAERIAAKMVLSPPPAPKAAPSGPGPRQGPGGPRAGPSLATKTTAASPTLTDEQAQSKFAQAYESEKAKQMRGIGQSCTKCHGKAGLDPATVADPHIPNRWLPRSIFGHTAHAFMACADCHATAAAVAPQPADVPADADALAWIGRTRDIMLPDMASCTACHSHTPTHTADAARFDCVLCHVYHPR